MHGDILRSAGKIDTVMGSELDKISSELQKVIYNKGNFLDCGCGDGSTSILLSKELHFKNTYGLDICEERLTLAESKGVRIYNSRIDKPMPFVNDFFDLVLSNHTIEHIRDTDFFLNEIYRVLKPGGIFCVVTPNLACWYNRIILLLGYQPHYTEVSTRENVGKLYFGKKSRNQKESISGHIRMFSYPALKDLLCIHHFTVLKSFGQANPFILTSRILYLFERLFSLNARSASYFCFISKKE